MLRRLEEVMTRSVANCGHRPMWNAGRERGCIVMAATVILTVPSCGDDGRIFVDPLIPVSCDQLGDPSSFLAEAYLDGRNLDVDVAPAGYIDLRWIDVPDVERVTGAVLLGARLHMEYDAIVELQLELPSPVGSGSFALEGRVESGDNVCDVAHTFTFESDGRSASAMPVDG